MVPLDILMKSAYIPLLFLLMSRLKSLKKSTRKTHPNLKSCFAAEKDTGKLDCLQLPMG